MRFIHIVPEPPHLTGSGAQLRAHALSGALAARGDVVTVVVADILARTGVTAGRRPSFIEADLPESVLAEVLSLADPGPEDRVIVEGVYLSAIARRLQSRGLQVILDAHNVESDLLRQTDLARHPILAGLQRRGRWRRAAEAERQLLQDVSAVWACSAMDALRLRRLAPNGAPIHVVPNPVPGWSLAAMPRPRPDGIDALFVGHLGYRPNIAAARRLVRGILPLLHKTDPTARITLAGRAPDQGLRRLVARAPIGVTLVSDPVELAPLYARATMALMPLTEGGGTRIKALEAMAAGLPVIASAKAVEGLGLVPGREYLAAEDDADFAGTALRLARSPALREELATRAREFAVRHHGPSAIEDAVAGALAGGIG